MTKRSCWLALVGAALVASAGCHSCKTCGGGPPPPAVSSAPPCESCGGGGPPPVVVPQATPAPLPAGQGAYYH
jgi:hypothetical protein